MCLRLNQELTCCIYKESSVKKVLGIILLVLIIFFVGFYVRHSFQSFFQTAVKKQDKKILYWVAPMDPNYRRDNPGKSPMGMDLVPIYADSAKQGDKSVRISPSVENNLGVKVAKVEKRDLSRIVNTVGYVTVDENNIEHVHSYTDGWIRKLLVKAQGEEVKKGQLLLTLYSPSLNSAQDELILAVKNNNHLLIRAGIKKLLTLGMSQGQIDLIKLTQKPVSQIDIYAKKSGIISQLNVREGKYIKPDTDIMTIEQLSPIWVIAEVFERQSAWVKKGQSAIATLSFYPGKTWEGRVDYVYPELDKKTHTLRVRLSFPNPDLTLKPKMYANIKIFSDTQKNVLAIPREALIRTGGGDRAIVVLSNGEFKAQAVTVGIESGDYYQILSGLSENDRVVTSAQFLIDSESSLKAALNRITTKSKVLKHNQHDKKPKEFVGMGKVVSVDLSKHILTLHHKPIPALNMPEMTMHLNVAKDIKLGAVKAGNEVHFVLIKQKDERYLIVKLHVMK